MSAAAAVDVPLLSGWAETLVWVGVIVLVAAICLWIVRKTERRSVTRVLRGGETVAARQRGTAVSALAAGISYVVVLAALGARWDQTLANMLLLALERFGRVPMRVVEGAQTLRVLRPGRPHQLAGASGDTLSLIPISGPAAGITTSGLDYPMQHGTLPFGATLGVSNVFTSATAGVTLESGLLLAIHISNVQ